jgi:hypothetical protein
MGEDFGIRPFDDVYGRVRGLHVAAHDLRVRPAPPAPGCAPPAHPRAAHPGPRTQHTLRNQAHKPGCRPGIPLTRTPASPAQSAGMASPPAPRHRNHPLDPAARSSGADAARATVRDHRGDRRSWLVAGSGHIADQIARTETLATTRKARQWQRSPSASRTRSTTRTTGPGSRSY